MCLHWQKRKVGHHKMLNLSNEARFGHSLHMCCEDWTGPRSRREWKTQPPRHPAHSLSEVTSSSEGSGEVRWVLGGESGSRFLWLGREVAEEAAEGKQELGRHNGGKNRSERADGMGTTEKWEKTSISMGWKLRLDDTQFMNAAGREKSSEKHREEKLKEITSRIRITSSKVMERHRKVGKKKKSEPRTNKKNKSS